MCSLSRWNSGLEMFCVYLLMISCVLGDANAISSSVSHHDINSVPDPEKYVRTDDTPLNEVLGDLEDALQLQPWQVQLTVFVVISVLIPVVCGTLYGVHTLFDHADEDIRPVVQQLTEELTGIAYLTVVVFCATSFIHHLSIELFGNTTAGKNYLGILLDNTSNMMTVIAAVNIIQVYLLIRLGNEVQARWKKYNGYCIDHEEGIIPDFYGNPSQKEMTYVERAKQYVHTEPRLTLVQSVLDYFCDPLNAYNKHREYIQKTELINFYSLRTEVILARSPMPPYLPVEKNRLPSNFDYAQYSSWSLGEILAETISVNRYVWYFVLVVAIIFCIIVMIVGSFKNPVVYITFVVFAYLEVYVMFVIYQKASSILKFLVNPKHLKYSSNFKDQFRLHKSKNFLYAREASVGPPGGDLGGGLMNISLRNPGLVPKDIRDELKREVSVGSTGTTLSGKNYRFNSPGKYSFKGDFIPDESVSDDEGCGESGMGPMSAKPFDPFAEEPVSDDEGCGESGMGPMSAKPFDPFAEEPVSDDEGCGESAGVPNKLLTGLSYSTDTEDAEKLWEGVNPILEETRPHNESDMNCTGRNEEDDFDESEAMDGFDTSSSGTPRVLPTRRSSATSHKYTMSTKYNFVNKLRNNCDVAALESDYDMPGWTLGIKRKQKENDESPRENGSEDCCTSLFNIFGSSENIHRHHELFWFGSLGPDFNMWTLKTHMFMQAIYVTTLLYFFVPHVYEEAGPYLGTTYLLAAMIPVIWMWVAFYEDLICIITFTASAGLLVNKILVNKVLNIQKIKRSQKMIHLLSILARCLGDTHRQLYDINDPIVRDEMDFVGTMFDSFDVKDNGEIPIYQIDQLLDNMGLSVGEHEHVEMIASIDVDGDGFVSRDEFIQWKLKFDRTDGYSYMKLLSKDLFRVIDRDGSGTVSAEEFGEGIRQYLEKSGEKGMKKREVIELIRDFDTNGDGQMDIVEFEKLIDFAYGYR